MAPFQRGEIDQEARTARTQSSASCSCDNVGVQLLDDRGDPGWIEAPVCTEHLCTFVGGDREGMAGRRKDDDFIDKTHKLFPL